MSILYTSFKFQENDSLYIVVSRREEECVRVSVHVLNDFTCIDRRDGRTVRNPLVGGGASTDDRPPNELRRDESRQFGSAVGTINQP